MQNDAGKLSKAIKELKKVPKIMGESVLVLLQNMKYSAEDLFTRENIVNAVMPKFFSRGINSALDYISKKKKGGGASAVNGSQNIPNDQDVDDDFSDEILNILEQGFEETNSNLVKILNKLGGDTSTAQLLRIENGGVNQSVSASSLDEEILQATENNAEEIAEVVAINGKVLRVLQRIDNNTRVDSLKAREDEIENRKQSFRPSQNVTDVTPREPQEGPWSKIGGISGLLDMMGGGKRRAGRVFGGLRRSASRIRGSISRGSAKIWNGAKGLASSAWSGVKTAGGKIGTTIVDLGKAGLEKGKGVLGAVKSGASTLLEGGKSLASSTASAIKGSASTLWDKGTGLASSAWNGVKGVGSKAGELISRGASGLTSVGEAITPKGGLVQGVKSLGGRAIGAPLSIGMAGYDALKVYQDGNMTKPEKTKEYSKIGGRTAGALAGMKAGATLGAFGGPIGAVAGGALGGLGGYFLGEKGGAYLGDLINSLSPSEAKQVEKQISSGKAVQVQGVKSSGSDNMQKKGPQINTSAIVKPSIGSIQPGQTKANNLQALTTQMESTNAEKQTLRDAPAIVPISINNSKVTNGQGSDNGGQSRMSVPMVRNQDGTIQRLLDLNYHPLMV